eukprot:RCo031709
MVAPLLLVPAIPIVAIVVLVIFFNPTLRAVLNSVGMKLIGAPITYDSLYFNPLTGTVALYGICLKNQPQFKTDHLVAVKKVLVQVDVKSVLSSVVVIPLVEIQGL